MRPLKDARCEPLMAQNLGESRNGRTLETDRSLLNRSWVKHRRDFEVSRIRFFRASCLIMVVWRIGSFVQNRFIDALRRFHDFRMHDHCRSNCANERRSRTWKGEVRAIAGRHSPKASNLLATLLRCGIVLSLNFVRCEQHTRDRGRYGNLCALNVPRRQLCQIIAVWQIRPILRGYRTTILRRSGTIVNLHAIRRDGSADPTPAPNAFRPRLCVLARRRRQRRT